jgi:hypothetical protein
VTPGIEKLFTKGALPGHGDGWPIGLDGVLAGGEYLGQEDGLNTIYRT